jgi:uncharacterized protein (DUF169 family)
MTFASIAERLTAALSLDIPPVGLTFTSQPPDGVSVSDKIVPSACSFWRLAEQSVFYAPAEDHFNCPVGSMVMGFELPAEVQQQLGGLVGSMAECEYLDPAEAAKIPTVSPAAKGILYGPLADLPMAPDAVLLWLTPRQAMFHNEAAGAASWTQSAPLVTGRPACAVIPAAMSGSTPAMSMGCAGMRTFTEISDDRILAVIPGQLVESYAETLAQTMAANRTMLDFYEGHKASVG